MYSMTETEKVFPRRQWKRLANILIKNVEMASTDWFHSTDIAHLKELTL